MNKKEFFNYFDGYNILYVDYHGYGLNSGSPSVFSLLDAGLIIYDYA